MIGKVSRSFLIAILLLITMRSNGQNSFSINVHSANYIGIRPQQIVPAPSDSGFILISRNPSVVLRMDKRGGFLYSKMFPSFDVFNVEETNDSGIIIAAVKDTVPCLIKLDASSNVSWIKCFPGIYATSATVNETSTGEFYLLAAKSGSSTSTVIKLDNTGNILWSNSYEISSISAVSTYNDDFAISGTSPSLLRIDGNGSIVFSNNYANAGYFAKLIESRNGDLIGASYGCLVRINNTGNVVSSTALNFGPGGWSLSGIAEDENLNVLLITYGQCVNLFTGQYWHDLYYQLVDSTGKRYAEKHNIHPSNEFRLTIDGVACNGDLATVSCVLPSTYMTINKYHNGISCADLSVVPTDSSQSTSILEQPYPVSSYPVTVAEQTLSDSVVNNPLVPGVVCYTGVEETPSDNAFNFFPNPASDDITIQPTVSGVYTVTLFDVAGRTVRSVTSTGTTILSISGLDNGVYVVGISTRDGKLAGCKKLIVAH
jgi:hypothetical protein